MTGRVKRPPESSPTAARPWCPVSPARSAPRAPRAPRPVSRSGFLPLEAPGTPGSLDERFHKSSLTQLNLAFDLLEACFSMTNSSQMKLLSCRVWLNFVAVSILDHPCTGVVLICFHAHDTETQGHYRLQTACIELLPNPCNKIRIPGSVP